MCYASGRIATGGYAGYYMANISKRNAETRSVKVEPGRQ